MGMEAGPALGRAAQRLKCEVSDLWLWERVCGDERFRYNVLFNVVCSVLILVINIPDWSSSR